MHYQSISDKELVKRYLAGSEAALEALINRYRNKVFTHLIILVKDKQLAEDLFQDTFIKAINAMQKGSYYEDGRFSSWVMRIAHNLAIDHFRKLNRMPTTNGGEDFDIFDTIQQPGRTVEEDVVHEELQDELRGLVEQLPEDQKTVLTMRHYSRMSFKDIAEETEVSINTALGRMRYALINLRKLMKEKQIDLRV